MDFFLGFLLGILLTLICVPTLLPDPTPKRRCITCSRDLDRVQNARGSEYLDRWGRATTCEACADEIDALTKREANA